VSVLRAVANWPASRNAATGARVFIYGSPENANLSQSGFIWKL
jgi:hypothetical protein